MDGACYAACGDGGVLRLLAAVGPRGPIDLAQFAGTLEPRALPLV
jgi:hypothetical protein